MKRIIVLGVLTVTFLSISISNVFALKVTEYKDAQGTRGRASAYYTVNPGPTVTLSSVTSYLSSMTSVSSWSYKFKYYNSSASYTYSGGPYTSNYKNRSVGKTLAYPYIDHDWYYTISGTTYHRYVRYVVVNPY